MTELRLRFVNGPRRGQEVAWAGPRVRIGRRRDNDAMLADREDAHSSAHHAEARYEDRSWWLVDVGSTNGTFVNGTRIVRHRLVRGDRLTLGDDELTVCGKSRLPGTLVVAIVRRDLSSCTEGRLLPALREPAPHGRRWQGPIRGPATRLTSM